MKKLYLVLTSCLLLLISYSATPQVININNPEIPTLLTAPGNTNTLAGFFTSFWKLADTSDSIGSNTLSLNGGGPTFGTVGCKIGDCASFTPNQFANRGGVSVTGPNFTIVCWFKSSTAGNEHMFEFYSGAAPMAFVSLNTLTAGKVRVASDATNNLQSTAATYGDGNWHLLVFYQQGNQNTLILDNGTPVTGTGTNWISGTPTVRLGAFQGTSAWWTGQIDAVGFADGKVPNAWQINALWNGGAGVEPPF